ncbi:MULTISPECIES: GAF domain-containing protein [Mumia]|uniref:GAF domain-containing protein n=1 Tax=Mumia TaxID=1546255 RepID=UPI0013D4BACE|nr:MULTISPECIES: GAF domain-containing protein [Mumia]
MPRASATFDAPTDLRAQYRIRSDVLAGRSPEQQPRPIVRASWDRSRTLGLTPDGVPPTPPVTASEVEAQRSASALRPMIDQLAAVLHGAVDSAGMLLAVTSADARILWRAGPAPMRKYADELGMVPGATWAEGNVGTNGIGTALVEGKPVGIHQAEHYAEGHLPWSCAAAPIRDPLTGEQVGAVDLSYRSAAVNPLALPHVVMAAQLAEAQLRQRYHESAERLRTHAAPMLARLGGPAIAVTRDGICAASVGTEPPARLTLPSDIKPGSVWLPGIGTVIAEPVPDGWLLRLPDDESDDEPTTVVRLDLTASPAIVQITGQSGSWSHTLSPRHSEIMLSLALHAGGRSASELADDLFADPARTVTVRAEMSRLRRTLGGLLDAMPYRISEHVRADAALPDDPQMLLPGSSAPIVVRTRADLADAATDADSPAGRHRAY